MVHSLHAYFLRRGDFNAPIIYQVDRSRDGHSFSNRRVVAIQHGEQIFNMTCSFQVEESGLEHQVPMPGCAGPGRTGRYLAGGAGTAGKIARARAAPAGRRHARLNFAQSVR